MTNYEIRFTLSLLHQDSKTAPNRCRFCSSWGDKGSAAPMTCFSRQSGCTRLCLDTFRVSPSPNGNRCKATPLFISTNASIMGTEIVTAHSVRLFRPRFARPYDSPLIWIRIFGSFLFISGAWWR